MSEARRQWPQTAAIMRHGADFDLYSSGGGGGATYHCGVGGADNIGDGEDSGYTEIPMVASTDPGLRDRIARLVFRPSGQSPQQPPPPPLPSQSSSRHRSGGNRTATGGFPGYAYTRWQCLPSSTPPPPRSAKPAAAASSSSQRTVRFRCPREQHRQAPSAEEDRWTTVQPYSTFAAGSMPALGERSASSGYGSDIDIVGAGSADFYAVREEDIDRLLLSSSKPSPAAPAEADVNVQTLDLTAYFPPSESSPAASNLPQKIDRIVGDVVRLKSAAPNKNSPRGRRQHQRLDFYDAASIELADMRPDASHRCYYQ